MPDEAVVEAEDRVGCGDAVAVGKPGVGGQGCGKCFGGGEGGEGGDWCYGR